jgi:hypothetical protein
LEANAIDIKGSGDAHEELQDDNMAIGSEDHAGEKGSDPAASTIWAPLGAFDEEDDEMEEWDHENMGLPKVLKAFLCLKENFDGKFKEIWA